MFEFRVQSQQLAPNPPLISWRYQFDQWDRQAGRYVGEAVTRRPGAFCYVGGFGPPADGGAQLLGILSPELRSSSGPEADIQACPEGFVTPEMTRAPDYSSSPTIPLLESLDP